MTPRRAGSLRLYLLLCFALAVAIFALLPLRKAEAHPLGNFTINHYSRIEFSDEAARVTYILDLAEIPTLQQKKHLDTDGDGTLSDTEAAAYLDDELPSLLKGLRLEVGNEVLPLRVLDRSAKFVAGQGGTTDPADRSSTPGGSPERLGGTRRRIFHRPQLR